MQARAAAWSAEAKNVCCVGEWGGEEVEEMWDSGKVRGEGAPARL